MDDRHLSDDMKSNYWFKEEMWGCILYHPRPSQEYRDMVIKQFKTFGWPFALSKIDHKILVEEELIEADSL